MPKVDRVKPEGPRVDDFLLAIDLIGPVVSSGWVAFEQVVDIQQNTQCLLWQ